MKKFCFTILLCLIGFIEIANAQIRTQRDYDYIGNEVNSAGLRVVGMKTKLVNDQYYDYYYGCINQSGEEVVSLIYDKIEISKDYNYIFVKWQGKEGLLTEDGQYSLIYPKYKHLFINPVIFKTKKVCIFQTNKDHFGIVNNRGEEIISPFYDEMFWTDNDNGYLAVKKDLWGIIRYDGNGVNDKIKEIIPFIYESMYWLHSGKGYLAVKRGGLWGIIRRDGCEIVEPQYKKMEGAGDFINVMNAAEEEGIIDSDNNVIVPFGQYNDFRLNSGFSIWCFKGRTRSFLNKTFCLINWKGQLIYSKKCSSDYLFKRKRWDLFPGGESVKLDGSIIIVKSVRYRFRRKKGVSYTDIYIDDNGQEHNQSIDALKANVLIRQNYYNNINNEVRKKLPVLTWLNTEESVMQPNYTLSVSVKSDSRIEDVSVTVNGNAERGINTVNSTGYNMTINKTVELVEGVNTIEVSVKNAAGTTREQRSVVYNRQGKNLPTIEWREFSTTAEKQDFLLKIGIKSKSKIEDVTITLNGVQTRGINTVETDNFDMTIESTLTLAEGTNRIVVSVRNSEGITSSEKVITYQGINPTPIINDKRIALVIGNSHYSLSENNLQNPENDARDIAKKLEELGFDVILRTDATHEEMEKALSLLREKAKEYDVALFYYAGHGIQSNGVNYMLPTDINDLAEDNLKHRCVNMGQVLDLMDYSQCKMKIAVFDACRVPPVSRGWYRGSETQGLSIMNAPTGTVISFSTAPGRTAQDGKGEHSPYTEAFLNALEQPNLDILHFFQKVGADVVNKTQNAQTPWLSSSPINGEFYFNKQ